MKPFAPSQTQKASPSALGTRYQLSTPSGAGPPGIPTCCLWLLTPPPTNHHITTDTSNSNSNCGAFSLPARRVVAMRCYTMGSSHRHLASAAHLIDRSSPANANRRLDACMILSVISFVWPSAASVGCPCPCALQTYTFAGLCAARSHVEYHHHHPASRLRLVLVMPARKHAHVLSSSALSTRPAS